MIKYFKIGLPVNYIIHVYTKKCIYISLKEKTKVEISKSSVHYV